MGPLLRPVEEGGIFQKYEEELEINDFPQQARWQVTSKAALQQIREYREAGITVRGTYYAPGKPVAEGERKLYLAIESTAELSVQKSQGGDHEVVEGGVAEAEHLGHPPHQQ